MRLHSICALSTALAISFNRSCCCFKGQWQPPLFLMILSYSYDSKAIISQFFLSGIFNGWNKRCRAYHTHNNCCAFHLLITKEIRWTNRSNRKINISRTKLTTSVYDGNILRETTLRVSLFFYSAFPEEHDQEWPLWLPELKSGKRGESSFSVRCSDYFTSDVVFAFCGFYWSMEL